MTTPAPDIFRNVHKGIRKALFEACVALGRAGDDPAATAAARAQVRAALRFVAHHGENEDLILLPALEQRAPDAFARIRAGHDRIDAALAALTARIDHAGGHEVYLGVCEFTARYLEHMREEELELEPAIRAALSADELAGFGRRSVERTAPADQRMMLASMLPAMTRDDADGFLARLPPALADELRPLR